MISPIGRIYEDYAGDQFIVTDYIRNNDTGTVLIHFERVDDRGRPLMLTVGTFRQMMRRITSFEKHKSKLNV